MRPLLATQKSNNALPFNEGNWPEWPEKDQSLEILPSTGNTKQDAPVTPFTQQCFSVLSYLKMQCGSRTLFYNKAELRRPGLSTRGTATIKAWYALFG